MILSKEVWDVTPVPQRVVNCRAAGLSGQVGSKEWDQLNEMEMMAVMGLKAPTYKGGVVVDEAEHRNQRELERLYEMRSVANDILAKILNK